MSRAIEALVKPVKTPGVALHRQIFVVLREQIMRGVYAAGAALPNEDELCVYFGVSKITVRRALADLKQLGLVERHQGRGTFVGANLPKSLQFEPRTFLDALETSGRETQVKVLEIRSARPPADVALQLKMPGDATAVYAARVRHVGDTPLAVTEAWVPADLGRRVTAAQLKKRPLYELLLEQGIEFGRVIEEITAVTANPAYARLLQADVGGPLLRVTRLVFDRHDRPVELLIVHLSPERSRILQRISPDEAQRPVSSRIVHDLIVP